MALSPPACSSSSHSAADLDVYAAEFASLVEQYPPRRTSSPSTWLTRLPDETFQYYSVGIATYGQDGDTPIERRGRLYLMHTGLVCLWMSWGRATARERFREQPRAATRRAASLASLEHYRRAGVLQEYTVEHWFYQPIDQWTVSIATGALDLDSIPEPMMRGQAKSQAVLPGTVETIATLRTSGALPHHTDLC